MTRARALPRDPVGAAPGARPVLRAFAPATRSRPRQYTRLVPIYEYACMECESHFEELVRSSDQAVTCPECGAAKV
ncbi:MAG: FmdB family zinc ribbon protein, partial [Gaiellaceae bacterium]